MIYRKRGRVARWEHGRLVVVSETGEAIEEQGVFEVRPLSGGAGVLAGPDESNVVSVAEEITRLATSERLVVSHGIAEHEVSGKKWTEETRRVHVAITHRNLRALIDRADFELAEIERIAGALRKATIERDPPARLRLARSVAAALLPSLAGVAPPNVRLLQSAGGLDGNGEEIAETAGPPWPNVFRPSYRYRPVRMPLNLRLECEVDLIDRNLPEAIALLAPVSGLLLRVLIADRRRVYPATIRISRIDAVAANRTWYPYGAGAFGSEIML